MYLSGLAPLTCWKSSPASAAAGLKNIAAPAWRATEGPCAARPESVAAAASQKATSSRGRFANIVHRVEACGSRGTLQAQRVEDRLGHDIGRRARRPAAIHGAAGRVSEIVLRESDAEAPCRI